MRLFTIKDLMFYFDRKRDAIKYYIEKARISPKCVSGFNSEQYFSIRQFEFVANEYLKAKELVQNRKNAKPYKLEKYEVINGDIYLYYNSKIN